MIDSSLKVTRDTFADQNHPAQRNSKIPALVLNNTSGHVKTAFVFVAPPPRGCTVVSATLHVHTQTAWGGSNTLTVKRVTQSWTEKNLNWNNRPDNIATHAGSVTVSGLGEDTEIQVDITSLFQDVANGASYYGLQLQVGTSDNRALWHSEAKTASLRPYVDIEYSLLPDAAGDLSPDADLAMYTQSPLLTWTFLHRTPGEEQSQSWVQITTDDDDTFASPVYDSDWQDNTENQWSLADAAVTLDTDTPFIWRVKVRDGHGVASDWSDTASFVVITAAGLTITAPATDGDDVQDSTPDIVWTFDGQVSWRAYLYHRVFDTHGYTDTLVSHQPRTVSNDHDWTPEEKVITKVGESYVARIDVWDDQKRPGPVTAERVFIFEETGSVESPVLVSADIADDGPGVHLTWTAPDSDAFAIVIDGEIVEVITPGSDLVEESGSIWEWTTYVGSPFRQHDYAVKAKTTDVGWSILSNVITVTPKPTGIWLVDDAAHVGVQILSKNENPQTLNQDGATFYMLNRRDPVRITGVTRGYAGTVSGTLSTPTTSAMHDLIQLLRNVFFTDEPNLNARLVFGNQSIPALVGDLVLSQDPTRADVYSISFDWWGTQQ